MPVREIRPIAQEEIKNMTELEQLRVKLADAEATLDKISAFCETATDKYAGYTVLEMVSGWRRHRDREALADQSSSGKGDGV